MKIFVIHRFNERSIAKKKIKSIKNELSIDISPFFLNSSGDEVWKEEALVAMDESEAIIIFNEESCNQSDNAKWEIEKAKEINKEIIYLSSAETIEESLSQLKALYELKKEFESCFGENTIENFELYKLMIESSESLIQRRQKTNAFFITVIGSLLAIAGLLIKTGTLDNNSINILYGFALVTLLLCNSWSNLIDNYGKLNKAKFDVILRLEKNLSAQIYSAEWVSLGKGLRPKKYKSFTSTERHVPLFFAILIGVLTLSGAFWNIQS